MPPTLLRSGRGLDLGVGNRSPNLEKVSAPYTTFIMSIVRASLLPHRRVELCTEFEPAGAILQIHVLYGVPTVCAAGWWLFASPMCETAKLQNCKERFSSSALRHLYLHLRTPGGVPRKSHRMVPVIASDRTNKELRYAIPRPRGASDTASICAASKLVLG